jgi:hypothetical protein
MEGPPPARAPLGRPTVLTDLPGDVLAYILSFIPFEEWSPTGDRVVASRFVATAACTALAAAARPPSGAWTDLVIPGRFFVESEHLSAKYWHASVVAQNALRDAMARAAPSVRRLSTRTFSDLTSPALMVPMVTPAAPFLEELKLDTGNDRIFSWVDPILAAATRLTRLDINKWRLEGPPPMIAAGRAAILAFRRDVALHQHGPSANFFDGLLALLRSLSATAIPGVGMEPPVLVRLEPLCFTLQLRREQAAFVRELTSVFGRHLTRLTVRTRRREDRDERLQPETPAEARTAVAPLLENRALPALRELVIDWEWSSVPLDLAAVRAPPTGLTFLSVYTGVVADVLLSPAIRAGLASLAVQCWTDSMDPPLCLRGAGGSFGRLTRLVYGSRISGFGVINLAPWGMSEFSLPTLVEMEAIGHGFTLNELSRWDRGSWCEGFLAALPRLARLVLRADAHPRPFRASADRLTKAAAVRNMITARLPQAAREAGCRLDVAVHRGSSSFARVARFGWSNLMIFFNIFELALQARPPG